MSDNTYTPDHLTSLEELHAKYSIDQVTPDAAPAAPEPEVKPHLATVFECWYRISIRSLKTKGHYFLDGSGGLTRQKVHAANFKDKAEAEKVAAEINANHTDVYKATVKALK